MSSGDASLGLQGKPVAGAREIMFQKPRQPYTCPPKCSKNDCINFHGKTFPLDTYWLCPDCVKVVCALEYDAYELGYARRPLDFYSNAKPWGPKKREEWSRSASASLLICVLLAKKHDA